MWIYWLMLLIPLLGVIAPKHLPANQGRLAWIAIGFLFALVIGLRHEVGADWFNYLPNFNIAAQRSLTEILGRGDPGYYSVNWAIARLGGSIYQVNLICAAVLMWGTVVFCRAQPNPWLALFAAVPYMLIVVGMGYTRQSVALGFALLGLAALADGKVRAFVLWVAVGATFHKSAVLLLPIAALAASRNRLLTVALVALTTLLLYYLLLVDASEALWENYVEAQRISRGGMIRVLMNVVPAVLLVAFRRKLLADPQERQLWLWMSLFSLACLPLVELASTAVDRVALYLIPIQIFVFARVPRLAHSVQGRTPLVLAIFAFYVGVLFIWLNSANHSQYWVPYQFMPLW